MKLIVITNPRKTEGEINIIKALFKNGLEVLHVRKPKYSRKRMREFLESIPGKYHNRIMLHSHHQLAYVYNVRGIHLTKRHKKSKWKLWWKLKKIKFKKPELKVTTSFHSLQEVIRKSSIYDYVMLSPVFDSISKEGYKAKYNYDSLKNTLEKSGQRVVALGGVDESKLEKARTLGFYGVALLGSVWHSSGNEVKAYNEIRAVALGKKKPVTKINMEPVYINVA